MVSLWPSISRPTLTLTLALECSRHCHHPPFLARCHWGSLYPVYHTEGPSPLPPLEHALLGPALNPEPTRRTKAGIADSARSQTDSMPPELPRGLQHMSRGSKILFLMQGYYIQQKH